MIKFFRNIRQKLLAEGKITNYLKYGIGEIILVVIGIMIAIQANNWNVERVAQKELAFSLNKLIVNLEQDVESLNKEMAGNKTIISNLDSCLIILKSPDKYTKSYFLKLFFPINSVAEFNSNKVSFNNLTSSGKFQSIRNEALIDSLFHYYNSEPYKPVENAIINHTRDVIRPYLMGFDFIPIHQDPLKSHDDENLFILHQNL
ncbi:MAG: hypothetical protein IPM42_11405 [Saprospiraceae bacterium]|nr:hypothetical protein [Saprospiraceae bacterium]